MDDYSSTLRLRTPRFTPHIFRCAAAALVAIACLAGCEKDPGSIAGKEPVQKVIEVESDVGALGAWAANKAVASVLVHIDPRDDMGAFPVSHMDNLEKVARRLRRGDALALDGVAPMIEFGGTVSLGYMAGLYKRVIWVIPSSRPVGERPVRSFTDYFIQRRGFSREAITGLKAEGAHITGEITGVPITITRLQDLVVADTESAIIDIDLAYFAASKVVDPAYRTGMRTLLEFVRELGAKNVRTKIVTVNLSTRKGDVAADLRYYGGVIREALANPLTLSEPVPDTWKRIIEAEDSLEAKRYGAAAAIYRDIVKTTKGDAGVYFSLAMAEGLQDKGPECRAALLEAYHLDGEYLGEFFRLARVLAASGKTAAGLHLIDTPDIKMFFTVDEIDYQRGLFFYAAHMPSEAVENLVKAEFIQPDNFPLLVTLYKAFRDLGDTGGQIEALQKLVSINESKVAREAPWIYADLGKLYEKRGDFASASKIYEKHIQAKPVDSLSIVFRERIEAWKAKGLK